MARLYAAMLKELDVLKAADMKETTGAALVCVVAKRKSPNQMGEGPQFFNRN